MGEIVKVINCLCKLLNNMLSTSLKPEFFRLSKINKLSLEETKQFWNILHKLCCFSLSGSCKDDDMACVTRHLSTEGILVAYVLPPEATPRQLLLCFGWLLSHGAIESIIDKIIYGTPLGKEHPFMPYKPDKPEPVSRPLENGPECQLNHAMFLAGLVKHNMRAISNHRQERAQLLVKLHAATTGACGLPHLSAGEVHLLSQPELSHDFVSQCHHCITTLETYSKWHKRSSVFWQWMDSVLKEEQSVESNKQLPDGELLHLIEFLKQLESNVRRIAILEDKDIAKKEFEFLYTAKMQLSKDGTILDRAIKLIDSKIEITNKLCRRKEQKLKVKLTSKETAFELDKVDAVFSQFGLNINQDIQLPSVAQLTTLVTQALSTVALEEHKQN